MSEPDSIPALPKPLEMAKLCISRAVNQGDIVIDATLGNGHDALFLAKLVGDQGKVIGFDIQQIAVDSASQRLANSGLNNYEFHCKGHQHIAQEVDESVSAVMFNLGYLPSADKSVKRNHTNCPRSCDGFTKAFGCNKYHVLSWTSGWRGGGSRSFRIYLQARKKAMAIR